MEKLSVEKIYKHKFSLQDLEVVQIKDINEVKTLEKLLERYYKCGFVIFEFANTGVNHETLEVFTNSLGLGSAYIPSVYKDYNSFNSKRGFNYLSQKNKDNRHKAFNTSFEQEIHSDGTLEKIGFIKTTLLYCNAQGKSGGENTVFNSVGAFYKLLTTNFDLAKSLLDTNSLRRVSKINLEEYIGPVFAINKNKIISRFSLDNTCDWNYGFTKVYELEKAHSYLKDLIYDGSPYFITFKLKPGQGLLMANDKISHGRKRFTDSNENKREMIRGLFNKTPSLNKGEYLF